MKASKFIGLITFVFVMAATMIPAAAKDTLPVNHCDLEKRFVAIEEIIFKTDGTGAIKEIWNIHGLHVAPDIVLSVKHGHQIDSVLVVNGRIAEPLYVSRESDLMLIRTKIISGLNGAPPFLLNGQPGQPAMTLDKNGDDAAWKSAGALAELDAVCAFENQGRYLYLSGFIPEKGESGKPVFVDSKLIGLLKGRLQDPETGKYLYSYMVSAKEIKDFLEWWHQLEQGVH